MKVLKDFGAVVQLPGNFLWTENLKVLFLFFFGEGGGEEGCCRNSFSVHFWIV